MKQQFNIIQPDDWHVHFREGEMLEEITQYSSRINKRCIAMPNTKIPITTYNQAIDYKKKIIENSLVKNFEPLIPCYLNENLEVDNFRYALKNNHFIGGKLYPSNVTTNSKDGINDISKIFNIFEIIEEEDKTLLIHAEKNSKGIDLFDREKYFIDDELTIIRKKFPKLKIVLEHISTSYGVDFVETNNNIAGTITPQHMLITKKDVFFEESIDPHLFCMPVVKNEKDLISLRKAACQNNTKFFLGTDSAPHQFDSKYPSLSTKPGIFSSICSLELYATIFEEENAIDKLEFFSSINGPKFYNLPVNSNKILLRKEEWVVPEFIEKNNIKVKNFFGGKKINWKAENLKV